MNIGTNSKTKNVFLINISLGLFCGFTALVVQAFIPKSGAFSGVFSLLNIPVNQAVALYASFACHGNADQAIREGMAFWTVYWLALGLGFELGGYAIFRAIKRFAALSDSHRKSE